MSIHSSSVQWQRTPHPSDPETYSRKHLAVLAGGQKVHVSAPVEYKGDHDCADPEQLLVSAVSSCHMLFFLTIAEQQGFTVDRYDDRPIGHLEKGAKGNLVITRVELSPVVQFGGDRIPDAAAIRRIHVGAHKNCFIGNSISADVVVREGEDAREGVDTFFTKRTAGWKS